MKRNVILLVFGVIIIGSCSGANLRQLLRPKRADYVPDYVLRSCIASAQLKRNLRTNDASQLSVQNSNLAKLYPESQTLDNFKTKSFVNSNKRYRNDLRSRARPKGGRHLAEKSTTDTPLGTVDVKAARKDIPKVFKKKDPLPELDRHGSARFLNGDAPIIIVQSLKH